MWIVGAIAGLAILGVAVFVVIRPPGPKPDPIKHDDPKPQPKAPTVASVSLQPLSMEMQAGERRKFLVQVQPPGASTLIRWETSDPTVASVRDGDVSAIAPGTALIRAVSLEDLAKQAVAEVIVAESQTVPDPQPRPDPRPDPRPRPNPNKNGTGDRADLDKGKQDGKGDTSPKGSPDAGGLGNANPNPDETGKGDQLTGFKAILTVTTAPPFAEVIVDGRFVGTTPVKDKELTAGKHKIQISHRSFPPIDTTVNLGPGEKTLRFRLFK
jgi:hypothetical protein